MTEPTYLREIRESYDTVAVPYAELVRPGLGNFPLERAMMGAFADRRGQCRLHQQPARCDHPRPAA